MLSHIPLRQTLDVLAKGGQIGMYSGMARCLTALVCPYASLKVYVV
jgi:hypothetical protein